MDEEYKNKMAWTPGIGSRLNEVLGSRPRAPSFSPTPPSLAGQSSERSPFWVWRAGIMGKIRQTERNRGDQAGAAETKYWRNQRKRGPKETKTTKTLIEGRPYTVPPLLSSNMNPKAAILCS